MARKINIPRLLVRLAVVVYFTVAALVLGTRYLVLPNIDRWRPAIAEQLSRALATPVSIEGIKAEWKGLNPRIALRGLALSDADNKPVLTLAHVRAVLGWRSLLAGAPQFVSLETTGIDLSIRRDAQHRWWLLGHSVETASNTGQNEFSVNHPALQWLLAQPRISLRNATIRWTDQTRSDAPLVLSHVALRIQNSGNDHRVALVASPPPGLGRIFDARAILTSAQSAVETQPKVWSGRVYVNVEAMTPTRWKPWIALPDSLRSGEVSAKVWLSLERNRFSEFALNASVKRPQWGLAENKSIQAQSARLFVSGQGVPLGLQDRQPLGSAQGAEAPAPVDVRFEADALAISKMAPMLHPLSFARVAFDGRVGLANGAPANIKIKRLHVFNSDMDATLNGTWQQGGSGASGLADIRGVFRHASIAAIDAYLPDTVSQEARQWMEHGLLRGDIRNAQLRLNGDLEHFPFGMRPDLGDFYVEGQYGNGIIDYMPEAKDGKKWPVLQDMAGRISLHRADLRLTAEQATIAPTPELPIQLRQVRARIANIERNSTLVIQGDTRANAEAYLALSHESPLGGMLDGLLDEARAEGGWRVPLRLTIPLLRSLESTVEGVIHFDGGSVTLMPEMPPLSSVVGALRFTETGFVSEGLTAKTLGGPLSMEGGVGGARKGLTMRGKATAAALREFVALEGMKRLEGQTDYALTLARSEASGYVLNLESDLTGLKLELPQPLDKPAQKPLKLKARWGRADREGNMALDVSLGPDLGLRLLRRSGAGKGSYFHAGTLSFRRKAATNGAGLHIDIRNPYLDVDAWRVVVDDFSTSSRPSDPPRERSLFPDLAQLRLQAEALRLLGTRLDQTTFTARRQQPLLWRFDVSSTQTAGTVYWHEGRDKVAGRLDAKFERLALGSDAEAPDANSQDSAAFDDDIDIPTVLLEVDNLSLYGRQLGRLSVRGLNLERGRLWRLEALSLDSPAAKLAGAGLWRLRGPDRGLVLDAAVDVADLGKLLDQMNFKDVVLGGKGQVTGRIEWRNLPWHYKKADLNGRLEFALENGRFITVNSRSARVLELLSLQSVSRLATFRFSPGNLLKEGYPFDDLKGSLAIDNGVLSTSNYRITGPVATIVLGGKASLTTEQIDLDAVVIPNVDVSGAAIAAGIAVNPIVGIGAFLTQWLLRSPLAKAMTLRYKVTGNWDDPAISEVQQLNEKAGETPAGEKG